MEYEYRRVMREWRLARYANVLRLRSLGLTLREVGNQLGLSAERTRQLEIQATRHLAKQAAPDAR